MPIYLYICYFKNIVQNILRKNRKLIDNTAVNILPKAHLYFPVIVGCPAIFLVGGKTTDTVPTPILVRSGDVIVMSKDSRYVYVHMGFRSSYIYKFLHPNDFLYILFIIS